MKWESWASWVEGSDLDIPNIPSPYGPRVVSVHKRPALKDGIVEWLGITDMTIGTRPLNHVDSARREGRLIAREGLKDVLAWLGAKAPGGPDWYNEPTGEEIFAWLKKSLDPLGVPQKFRRAVVH